MDDSDHSAAPADPQELQRQDQLLAQLLAQQEEFDAKFTRISIHGVRLPDGAAADAERAFEAYLRAVAQERSSPVALVKQHVRPADAFDPQAIQAQLHDEAVRAKQKEVSPTGRQSVAGKKMAAYVLQEHLVRCLEHGYQAPSTDRYNVRPMPSLG